MKKEPKAKRAKAQRPVQRATKEVLAELVEKLRGKLEPKATSASPGEVRQRAELSPIYEVVGRVKQKIRHTSPLGIRRRSRAPVGRSSRPLTAS